MSFFLYYLFVCLFHCAPCQPDMVNSAQRIMTTMNQEINLVAPGHRTLSPRNRCRRLTDMNSFWFFSPFFATAVVQRPLNFMGVFLWLMSELYYSNMLNKRSTARKGEALSNKIMVLSIFCLIGSLLHSGSAIFDVSPAFW